MSFRGGEERHSSEKRRIQNRASSISTMGYSYLFLELVVFVAQLALSEESKCCSDQRCVCILSRDFTYTVNCSGLGLNTSSFPHFFKNVSSIILTNNFIEDFPSPITKFLPASVNKLDVSNNKFHEIREDSLTGLKYLKHLDVSTNNLRRIHVGALVPLTSLNSLNISLNRKLTFRVFRNISHDLQYTQIKVLRMEELHCVAGVGTMLFIDDVEYLFNTSLQELYLSYNRLQFIEFGALLHLPKSFLKMDVSYNKLSIGMYILDIVKLDNLASLSIGPTIFGGGGGVENLENCHDWRGPKYKTDNEIEVHASNRIKSLSMLQTIMYKIPPKLKILSSPRLGAKSAITQVAIQKKNSLEFFDIGRNNFNQWIGPLKNFKKLKYADLSNNGCYNISKVFLHGLPALHTLKVNNNLLGRSMTTDIEGEIFQDSNRLKYLTLSNNDISALPPKIFKGLASVEYLNISTNYLNEWEVRIKHMHNLKWLDLSKNRLQSLSKETQEEIEQLLLSSNLSINLANNVLQCSCDTRKFLKWILEKSHVFVGFRSYKCFDEQGKDISFSVIEDQIQYLDTHCAQYSSLVISITFVIILFIAITIGGITYRYRWKLRYIYYMTKLKMKTEKQSNDNVSHPYEFDAFISYANEDRIFVEGQLRETLEEKYYAKLQLHARDFLGGKNIAENITDAVHKSHKTVIMLSSHFLKSYWCMFEFNMARMESVYSRGGENVIVVAFLEHIKSRDLPLIMMDVVESDCYIEHPNNEQNKIVFIDKIHKAITRN